MTELPRELSSYKDTQQGKSQRKKQRLVGWTKCDTVLVIFVALFLLVVWLLNTVESRLGSSPRTSPRSRKMTCYYPFFPNRSVLPGPLPRHLCTHIILGFATVGSDYLVNISALGGKESLRRELRKVRLNGTRKVMLSVGGGGSELEGFSNVLKDPDLVEILLGSTSELLKETGLDGIDFDWEFPPLSLRYDFAIFLEKTRTMLDKVGIEGNRTTLLSVALPGPFVESYGFPVDSLTRYCDFVNVMTYDLVLLNPVLRQAAFHSALFSQGILYTPCTVDFAIRFWLVMGIPRQKICMGIPTYGVAYRLKNENEAELHAAVSGYSGLGSNLHYGEICELANLNTSTTSWSEQSKVPYMDDGRGNWVSYDNVRSVEEKVEYAKAQGLGGLMIFSLNADDPKGVCGEGEFPLTRAAHDSWTGGLKTHTEAQERFAGD